MIDLDTSTLPEREPNGFPLHVAFGPALAAKQAYDPAPPLGATRVRYRNDTADLHYCARSKILIIAICGSNDARDWTGNLRAFRIPLDTGSGRTGLRVHQGFYEASLGLSNAIFRAAGDLLDYDFPRKVIWASHSRGAGISPHCMMQVGFPGFPTTEAYLFGMPRTGNRAWAAEFDAAFPNVWRVVLRGDIVSRVLRPWTGYWHVGRFAYIDRRNRMHTAATGYPNIWLDRAWDALNDLGRPGLAAVKSHSMADYLTALGAAR